MPIYIYKSPNGEEYKEVVQTMAEDHVYFDSEGLKWKRVFTVPNASIDTSVDPYSSREFVEKTSNKKGTYGDMMDYSQELSHTRAEKNGGIDPVKEKYYKDYSKKRNGAKHFDQMKTETKNNKQLNVDL
jgi:hypothetical protein|tara:strand:+ start:135 stop:521 length:387 start_codon:yes stop_codon:yes gene_type:complete